MPSSMPGQLALQQTRHGARMDAQAPADLPLAVALLLQGKIRCRKRICIIDIPDSAVPYGMVLAIDAAEIATGEEHRAGTARSADKRLFPLMQHDFCNPRQRFRTAQAALYRSIRAALARA